MNILTTKQLIIHECESALSRIDDDATKALIEAIRHANKVFFIGVGRVFLSLESFCKRLSHLGIDAHCVGEICEPAITDKDLLIVGSGSGESIIPLAITSKAKEIGAVIAWIGSNQSSTISNLSDITVRIPVQTKLGFSDELKSQQPMTTLFEQCLLLYGDVIAKIMIEESSIDMDALWFNHANLE